MTKFYIYKITLKSGSTYIGSHIERKSNDGYSNSSRYVKRHPEDPIVSREILFYLPTLEQMNIMETIAIISDKINSPKNINGNYGNWIYNFHSKLDCPWNKGLKMSKEFCEKMSEREREAIICLETDEVFSHTNKIPHAAQAINGKRESANGGLHYRKFIPGEDEDDTTRKNNNIKKLKEIYKNKKFIYSKESKRIFISWESIIREDHHSIKTIKSSNNYEIVDYDFILKNNLELPSKKQKPKDKLKIKNIETGEFFSSIKEAEKKYKHSHISDCLNGKRKTTLGYHWEIVQEDSKKDK